MGNMVTDVLGRPPKQQNKMGKELTLSGQLVSLCNPVNFYCQHSLEHLRMKSQLRNCPDQTGLWTHLWEIVLINCYKRALSTMGGTIT